MNMPALGGSSIRSRGTVLEAAGVHLKVSSGLVAARRTDRRISFLVLTTTFLSLACAVLLKRSCITILGESNRDLEPMVRGIAVYYWVVVVVVVAQQCERVSGWR
jgi:hypothetical protein